MNQEVQRIKNDAARRAAAVQRLADGAASLADVALLVGGGGLAGVALKQAIKTAVRYCGKDTRCLVGTLGTEIGAEVLAEVSAGGAIASNGLDDIVEKIAAKKAQKTGSAGQNNGKQTANNNGGKDDVGEATNSATIGAKTCVYDCVVDGTTRYVGITDDVTRRGAEHMAQKGIRIEQIDGLDGLSRSDARAVEQALIHTYGLGKDGGTLINKINSISPTKNPTSYEQSLKRGFELLDSVDYQWKF